MLEHPVQAAAPVPPAGAIAGTLGGRMTVRSIAHLMPMPVGSVIKAGLDGEPVVLVASAPHGWPVVFCPEGWRWLRMWLVCWRYAGLRVGRFGVEAYAVESSGHPVVARLMAPAKASETVVYRNGSNMDLRLSNLFIAPRRLVRDARRRASEKVDDDGLP
jgi:hypothetical protein